MYIEPLACGCKNRKRYGGDWDAVSWNPAIPRLRVECFGCGLAIANENKQMAVDQLALSSQIQYRLTGLSNEASQDTINTKLNTAFSIDYARPFDMFGLVSATPMIDGYTTIIDGDKNIAAGVTMSHDPMETTRTERIPVLIRIAGLVEINTLPTWHVLLYSGLYVQRQGLYRAALIDYAVAFEAFLYKLLREEITRHHGEKVTISLFEKYRNIDERFRGLLDIAIGHTHNENEQGEKIYQAWSRWVQQPRNMLAHGDKLVRAADGEEVKTDVGFDVTEEQATRAYTTTYHAIRWLQDLRARDTLSKNQNQIGHSAEN